MPGIHHPPGLKEHRREVCKKELCGMEPWRAEDQALYKEGYRAGYFDGVNFVLKYWNKVNDILLRRRN